MQLTPRTAVLQEPQQSGGTHRLAPPAGCSRFPTRTAANHVARSALGTARSPSQNAPHQSPSPARSPPSARTGLFQAVPVLPHATAEQKEGTRGTARPTARQHRSAASRHSASPALCQRGTIPSGVLAALPRLAARCTGCTPSRGSTARHSGVQSGALPAPPLSQPPKHRSVPLLQPRLRAGAAPNAAGPPPAGGRLFPPAAPKSQPHSPILPSHTRTIPRAAPGPAQPNGRPTERERRWPQTGKGPGEAGGPGAERGARAEPRSPKGGGEEPTDGQTDRKRRRCRRQALQVAPRPYLRSSRAAAAVPAGRRAARSPAGPWHPGRAARLPAPHREGAAQERGKERGEMRATLQQREERKKEKEKLKKKTTTTKNGDEESKKRISAPLPSERARRRAGRAGGGAEGEGPAGAGSALRHLACPPAAPRRVPSGAPIAYRVRAPRARSLRALPSRASPQQSRLVGLPLPFSCEESSSPELPRESPLRDLSSPVSPRYCSFIGLSSPQLPHGFPLRGILSLMPSHHPPLTKAPSLISRRLSPHRCSPTGGGWLGAARASSRGCFNRVCLSA